MEEGEELSIGNQQEIPIAHLALFERGNLHPIPLF
jgi:hypothetical protein